MKKFLIGFAALSLVACNTAPPSSIPTPGQIADRVKLDEKAGIAVETMYTALVTAGALAFRSGVVKPSTNPSVQTPGFCGLVLAGQFTPTDRGSQVSAIECRLRDARDKTRTAYDAANADGYDTAARLATTLGKELLALLRSN